MYEVDEDSQTKDKIRLHSFLVHCKKNLLSYWLKIATEQQIHECTYRSRNTPSHIHEKVVWLAHACTAHITDTAIDLPISITHYYIFQIEASAS